MGHVSWVHDILLGFHHTLPKFAQRLHGQLMGFGLINHTLLVAGLPRCNHSTHEMYTSCFLCRLLCMGLHIFRDGIPRQLHMPGGHKRGTNKARRNPNGLLLQCKPSFSVGLLVNVERHDWNTIRAKRVGKY